MISFSAHADFNYEAELVVAYPTGIEDAKKFAIAYRQKDFDHEFQIGENTFKVSGQPESYSFAMVLEPNNLVRIMEFSKKQFETFEMEIGDYEIALKKKVLNNPVKGDYILSINNVDYFFQHNLAQITFVFNDEGIKEIEVDGMVASLGVNEAKDKCAEFEDGSEEKKECEYLNK